MHDDEIKLKDLGIDIPMVYLLLMTIGNKGHKITVYGYILEFLDLEINGTVISFTSMIVNKEEESTNEIK